MCGSRGFYQCGHSGLNWKNMYFLQILRENLYLDLFFYVYLFGRPVSISYLSIPSSIHQSTPSVISACTSFGIFYTPLQCPPFLPQQSNNKKIRRNYWNIYSIIAKHLTNGRNFMQPFFTRVLMWCCHVSKVKAIE